MRRIIAIVVLLLAGIALLYFVPVREETSARTYASDFYGISFSYPLKYLVTEVSQPSGERIQHAIVLIEDTEENRAILAGERPGTEGPPTIIIGIYQNNLDHYTAESFIRNTSFSNFKLSDGALTSATIGGEPALRYSATGLYENVNAVVARSDYVYMFTSYYFTLEDAILADFEEILKSVEFSDGGLVETPTSADNAPPGSIHNLPVPEAVAAVRAHVAEKFGIEEGLVIILTAYEREWPDACLGLAGSDEMCAQVITPGYEVTAKAGNNEVAFRTNADGSELRQER